jgi:hypothetical protein
MRVREDHALGLRLGKQADVGKFGFFSAVQIVSPQAKLADGQSGSRASALQKVLGAVEVRRGFVDRFGLPPAA